MRHEDLGGTGHCCEGSLLKMFIPHGHPVLPVPVTSPISLYSLWVLYLSSQWTYGQFNSSSAITLQTDEKYFLISTLCFKLSKSTHWNFTVTRFPEAMIITTLEHRLWYSTCFIIYYLIVGCKEDILFSLVWLMLICWMMSFLILLMFPSTVANLVLFFQNQEWRNVAFRSTLSTACFCK